MHNCYNIHTERWDQHAVMCESTPAISAAEYYAWSITAVRYAGKVWSDLRIKYDVLKFHMT